MKFKSKIGPYSFDLVDGNFVYAGNDISRLIDIFSQPGFSDLFGGREMNREAVKRYLNWAKNGVVGDRYYLHLVRDENNIIVGGFDVQKKDSESASIGFWKDSFSHITMTKVVLELVEKCKNYGLTELDAYTDPNNVKAMTLLDRCGFLKKGEVEGRTKKLVKFLKKLD